MAYYEKLPSGNIRAQIRIGSVSRNKTLPTLREAQKWAEPEERKIKENARRGVATPPTDAFVRDLIEKYAEEQGEKISRSTHFALRKLAAGSLGAVKLRKLNQHDFTAWIGVRSKEVSGATLSGDLTLMGAVLKWGLKARGWDVDPKLARDAHTSLKEVWKIDTAAEVRDRIPTAAEIARLVEYFDAQHSPKSLKMAQLTKVALATSFRLGEIVGIKREDIDPAARTIILRNRKHPTKKASNTQIVPLLPQAWALFESMLAADGTTGPLFPNTRADSASTAWWRACKELGIEDLHFHDLRHAAITQLFRDGLTIEQVAVISGHKQWATLKIYSQINAADVHAAFQRAQTLRAPSENRAAQAATPSPGITHVATASTPEET